MDRPYNGSTQCSLFCLDLSATRQGKGGGGHQTPVKKPVVQEKKKGEVHVGMLELIPCVSFFWLLLFVNVFS